MAAMLLNAGCGRESNRPQASSAPTTATNQDIYQVKGNVIELSAAEKSIRIKHEPIPGYMPAMTMLFDVKDTNELTGLQPGDNVSFRMIVTATDGWIDQLRKLSSNPSNSIPPSNSTFRVVRDVEPLALGDPVPEYHFTNQLGAPISLSQFKGQALAINFLFTRCPFPTFCPLTANNFAMAQQKLAQMTNGPTNWHMLTITIDPEFDKPAILKAYGERYGYDPARWTLATGELIDITAIAEQFGQTFWHDETGSISHNLRTAVIGASGRVHKLILGNKWTADELVAELVEAARK
jgi:protein SCO1/2